MAFVSQSGALCTSVLDWALEENVGFSYFVSIGNTLDVDFGDLIDYFGEDDIETPSTIKHGLIVAVTREAIFFDRTNLILSRAAEVGEVLGLNKEKRLVDLVIGATNNYKWKGTAYDTYQAAAPWINTLTDPLLDWTDVDQAEQLLAGILDPSTGEAVLATATTLLVGPALQSTAQRILRATELRYGANTDTVQTFYANPLAGQYNLAVSRLATRRLAASGVSAAAAAKYWFLGDFRRALAYMENWPITVTQSPANSEADFNQDIVVRFKASERGAAAVINPRHLVKCTG